MSSEYDDWTVARLKDELRERNLTISGKKSIRIFNLKPNDLRQQISNLRYDIMHDLRKGFGDEERAVPIPHPEDK